MVTAKPKSAVPETVEEDPNAQYIEYREPTIEMVDVPGVGPTAVTTHVTHRVLLSDWPAYEKELNDKKGL